MIAIVSSHIRPETPSEPGATLRETIFFVASSISSFATPNSFLHCTVLLEEERGCPGLSSCGGNSVRMISSSTAGSISAVSGGAPKRSFFITISHSVYYFRDIRENHKQYLPVVSHFLHANSYVMYNRP